MLAGAASCGATATAFALATFFAGVDEGFAALDAFAVAFLAGGEAARAGAFFLAGVFFTGESFEADIFFTTGLLAVAAFLRTAVGLFDAFFATAFFETTLAGLVFFAAGAALAGCFLAAVFFAAGFELTAFLAGAGLADSRFSFLRRFSWLLLPLLVP